MRRTFLLLILVIAAAGYPAAQQPFFKNFQIKDGLLSNYIYFVFQDSKGYIWVSSDVGVSRFDGQTFTNYNTGQGVPDNEVFSMFEDSKGRIWFATLNGKPGFFQNGVFYNEKNDELLRQKEVTGIVNRIFENQKGEIVYVYNYRLTIFNPEKNTARSIPFKEPMCYAWEMPNGNIGIAGTKVGVYSEEGYRQLDIHLPVSNSPIRFAVNGDSLLFACAEGLSLYDLKSLKKVKYVKPLESGDEFIYLNFVGGKLWGGSRKAIALIDYPSLTVMQSYLKGHSVTSMLQDREGGWWFSTLEDGLYYVPAPDILHFTTAEGLLYNRVICLSRNTDGKLWIGSEGSTYSVFDGQTIQTRQILKESIKNKNIVNIRHFPDGTTLVVGKAGTLILKGEKEGFLFHRATDINIDKGGNYWTTLNGVYKIDKDDVVKKTFPVDLVNSPNADELYKVHISEKVVNVRAERIVFDQENRMWLASPNGLFSLTTDKQLHTVLPYSIKDLLFDKKSGLLWVLSESKGLFALQSGQIVDSIKIANNRGDVICWDLCEDDAGNFWIGSAGGLFLVERIAGQLKRTNYWGVYGLSSEKINAVEVIGDHVFIGKDDGLLQVPRKILTQSSSAPPVQINLVRVKGSDLPSPYSDNLQVEYGQQQLFIHFEGLSYREPQNIQYKYRLIGLNEAWNITTNEAVEYAGLRPGKYVFEVYAINGTGIPSAVPARLIFTVLTPYWQKSWFYLLVFLLAALFVWMYIKSREKKLHLKYEVGHRLMETNRQNTELQKKNTDLRMLALRLQMNPHFIFNALNTIKGYYGQDKIIEANSFISKFARLLRLNLDYSDSAIPLEQEIELLKIYVQLSKIRYPDKISLKLDISPEINPVEVLIPSMLIQPFVENAVIHGIVPKKGTGTIYLSFSKKDKEIMVQVTDDGVGRASSAGKKMHDLHKPRATAITIDRLRLLREHTDVPVVIRDLYDEAGKAAGTEVTLYIPFQVNQPS